MGRVCGMEISSPTKITAWEEKLAAWEEKLAARPREARLFFPWADFEVKFPYLKCTAHSEIVFL